MREKNEKYVCDFCQCADRESFTTGCFYECRKCRALRSRDINHLEFFKVMERQTLFDTYWKIAPQHYLETNLND